MLNYLKIMTAASLCAIAGVAEAKTADIGGITWSYWITGGHAEVFNDYGEAAISTLTPGAITIPSSFKTDTNTYEVTSIGCSAFENCTNLTSVTIPVTVTNIHSGAFYFCNLETFIVDSQNQKFCVINRALYTKDGTMLVHGVKGDVVIPEGVTSIGDEAFWGCSGLRSLSIPASLDSVGYDAFHSCKGITNYTVATGNSLYSSHNGLLCSVDGTTVIAGINGDVVIPEGITSFASGAFMDYLGLTSVVIPNSVTSIPSSLFGHCTGLTSVTIPGGVESIGDAAFSFCTGLTSVEIKMGVERISGRAFQGCTSLTNLIIPSSVCAMGNYAFGNCALENVIVVYEEGEDPDEAVNWVKEMLEDFAMYNIDSITFTARLAGDTPIEDPSLPTYIQGQPSAVVDRYRVWANEYGEDTNSEFEEAFLLDLDPDWTDWIEDEKVNFWIESFSYNDKKKDWDFVIHTNGDEYYSEGEKYYNGYIVIRPVELPGAPKSVHLFKAVLSFTPEPR